MSIKELLNYEVKSAGGKVPKAAFVPPVSGFLTPSASKKADEGSRQIYFESDAEKIFNKLLLKEYDDRQFLVSVIL